jgi:hypothetical protein
MRTNLDCFPSFLRQPLEGSRMATEDENTHRRVLDSVQLILSDISLRKPPPEIAVVVHQRVKVITGNPDLYKEVKLPVPACLPAGRHGAALPGNDFLFHIVPLDRGYPTRAGRGTLRSRGGKMI